jgi:hypothetical protein
VRNRGGERAGSFSTELRNLPLVIFAATLRSSPCRVVRLGVLSSCERVLGAGPFDPELGSRDPVIVAAIRFGESRMVRLGVYRPRSAIVGVEPPCLRNGALMLSLS